VRVITDNDRHRERNVMDKFEQYLRRNRVEYTVAERKRYTITQAGEVRQEIQKKIIHTPTCVTFEFDWATLSSKKYGGNPVTDALRIEHLVV